MREIKNRHPPIHPCQTSVGEACREKVAALRAPLAKRICVRLVASHCSAMSLAEDVFVPIAGQHPPKACSTSHRARFTKPRIRLTQFSGAPPERRKGFLSLGGVASPATICLVDTTKVDCVTSKLRCQNSGTRMSRGYHRNFAPIRSNVKKNRCRITTMTQASRASSMHKTTTTMVIMISNARRPARFAKYRHLGGNDATAIFVAHAAHSRSCHPWSESRRERFDRITAKADHRVLRNPLRLLK
jgi:hypothetical protein